MAVAFAERMNSMKASDIRELLKMTQRPEIISFAGGMPAPELFPVEKMQKVAQLVLAENGAKALQYSSTEGFEPLRKQISDRMNRKFKVNVPYENVIILSGSQQALDFTGKLFLDKGDVVLCESPTYLAALSAFKAYQPKFIEVPTDDEGMIISELEAILKQTPKVKLVYVIPDFQNPTGKTWSTQRRRAFMDVINKYEVPVVEDNPYGELRFEGEFQPSLKSMDKKDLIVYCGTFSKTLAPGLRIGWVAASASIVEKYVFIKQAADLHTSSISQLEISKFLELYDLDEHVAKINKVYGNRRSVMIEALETYLPAKAKFTRPEGGLFTWVELPGKIDTKELLQYCLKKNVAFVPGHGFYPNRIVENTMRLNYSNMSEEKIMEGIKRIGDSIKALARESQVAI